VSRGCPLGLGLGWVQLLKGFYGIHDYPLTRPAKWLRSPCASGGVGCSWDGAGTDKSHEDPRTLKVPTGPGKGLMDETKTATSQCTPGNSNFGIKPRRSWAACQCSWAEIGSVQNTRNDLWANGLSWEGDQRVLQNDWSTVVAFGLEGTALFWGWTTPWFSGTGARGPLLRTVWMASWMTDSDLDLDLGNLVYILNI